MNSPCAAQMQRDIVGKSFCRSYLPVQGRPVIRGIRSVLETPGNLHGPPVLYEV